MQRKRNRKIWSCLECRRKKLQCDHASPACGRCVKAGRAAHCVYINAANSTTSPDSANGTLPAETTQHSSVVHFRDDVIGPPPRPLKRLALDRSPGLNDTSLVDADDSALQGACFRTRFTGNTITSALNEVIPGFNSLTSHVFATYPIMDQVAQFLTKREGRVYLNIPEPPMTSESELRTLLPSRIEAERLVQIYFETFDLIYPVLYAPQFEQDYIEVWDSPGREDARPIILVLLVIAIAYCLESTPFVPAGQEVLRDKATRIIDCCDCWLHMRVQRQSRAIDFQLQFLLYLAKQVNAKRAKRTWVNAGSLVRGFMIAGLHRHPERLPRETTRIDQVMRRRLWSAVADFELQAAFEQGMPASPWISQSDSPPPPNLKDADLDKAQKSHQSSVFTKSSYLSISADTLELRHELNTELNDLRSTIPSDRVAEYTQELKRAIQRLPNWTENASSYPRALLLINYHQYIIALHAQQLHRSTSSSAKDLSRFLMLNSALQILQQHNIASQSPYPVVDMFYNTHARAALSICYAYTTSNPACDQLIMSSIEHDGLGAIDRAIALVGEKCIKFGMSSEHIWLMNAAKALIQIQMEPTRKDEVVRQAVDRFKEPFERLTALTTDTNGSNQQLVADPTLGQAAIPKVLDDIAECAFDDWTFDPVDFLPFDNRVL